MSATASLPFGYPSSAFISSPGVSEDVSKVADAAKSFFQYLSRANVAYGHLTEIQHAIDEAAASAANEDWDGEGGLPVTSRTIALATRFAAALPSDVKVPDVYPESHGELTFEWRAGKGRIVTVSVYPNGTIGYASLIGTSKAYGIENFISTIPSLLIQRIARIYT